MRPFAVLLLFLSLSTPAFPQHLARYVLILADPPAAAAGRANLAAARARNMQAHTAVRNELNTRHIPVTAESHTLLNAIFVSTDSATIDQLKTIPGVSYVVRVPRFHRNLDRAEQLINVPAAWNFFGGISNAGTGIKIGIIDTGIQTSHPAFQDASLSPPASFPVCSIYQQPNAVLDCTQFTNNKIIVARSYVPLVAAGTPANSRPDDYSPRDRVGHGTAVAMAAAGVTSAGPADTITGVAPKAFLGSYKVFGSPGVNDYTSGDAVVAALEDAFNDGMDVAVLSLGGAALSGPLDQGATCGLTANQSCDPEATAVQNAVNSGMVVVVAAGNEGDTGAVQPTLGTMDTPGDAPNAIAVAATTNSHSWSTGLTVAGTAYRAQLGGGPAPAPSLTGPLSDVASVGDPLACNPVPAGSLSGTIALVSRGTCTFVVKVQNLQTAGAIGAVITNNPGDDTIITPGGLSGTTTIPATFIGYDDGQTIRTQLQSSASRLAAIITSNLQPYDVTTFNQVASFSSRGPVLGTGAIKPDVAAVGTDLYLAGQTYDPNGELYTPSGFLVSQGTSFSTPQIAGIAALVKQANQANPNLTALNIKSAIVNTATQDVTDNGATASFLAVGAGKANAASAVMANLVASSTSASFGILRASSLPITQQIQLTNLANSTLTLSLSINRRTSENNAHISIDRPNITIAAGQSASLNITLSGSLPSPGSYEGFIVIQGAATVIQIPYLYIVNDGVPYNIVSVVGDGDDGTAGQPTAEQVIILQVTDRYGVPVPNLPVHFSVVSGGGSLRNQDPSTDVYGLAGAEPILGSVPGTNTYLATAGGLSTTFTATSRPQPLISAKGVVDAASFTSGASVAPGSYIAIFGANLSPVTQTESTPYLPVSIDGVSVSFDTATTSAPGHLHFATPGQVNVQVPWELQGQSSAQMKISIADSSGNLYSVPLATYSPGIFQIPIGGANYAAARDENFNMIGPSNPALQGHNIQIYCNGLGPVSNQPASGQQSPSNPLATTMAAPTVMIGGQNATVLFSGLTPTTVGLYQLNVTVPNVGSGVKPVTVSIGGVTSKSSSLAVQ